MYVFLQEFYRCLFLILFSSLNTTLLSCWILPYRRNNLISPRRSFFPLLLMEHYRHFNLIWWHLFKRTGPDAWNKLHIHEHKRTGKGPKWFEWKKIYQVAAIKMSVWPAFYRAHLHLTPSLWLICHWLSPEECNDYADACNPPGQDWPHIIWTINPRAKLTFCGLMLLQKASAISLCSP